MAEFLILKVQNGLEFFEGLIINRIAVNGHPRCQTRRKSHYHKSFFQDFLLKLQFPKNDNLK